MAVTAILLGFKHGCTERSALLAYARRLRRLAKATGTAEFHAWAAAAVGSRAVGSRTEASDRCRSRRVRCGLVLPALCCMHQLSRRACTGHAPSDTLRLRVVRVIPHIHDSAASRER
jgi:hypothetical protein